MKRLIILVTVILCPILNVLVAQVNEQCTHCRMNMQDPLHTATAQTSDGEILHFGSIECLVNYLKNTNEANYSALKVRDYTTEEMILARDAYYLISQAIPSPMGADLSAFKTKEDALAHKTLSEDTVFTWTELRANFKNPKYGIIDHHHHSGHYRPDSHAPAGVMGDHLHPKGGLMFSLGYMHMAMNGNKSGTRSIDNEEIFTSYMVAPQEMTMDMYMLGIMYAPSDKITLMAMQNLVVKKMDLTARMMMNGMTIFRNFSTGSSGLGDLKISAMYGIINHQKSSFHLNGSVSIPVGDLQQRDDTPMMANAKLPYAMQSGSGTFDVTLGGTYKESYQSVSWGTQFLGTIRLNENSEHYRFGNQYQLNVWVGLKATENISFSGRILGVVTDKIRGADPQLNPMMVTTADTENYSSDKLKSFLGANISFPASSALKKVRFGVEAGLPFYENYYGIQMDEDFSLNLGVKYEVL